MAKLKRAMRIRYVLFAVIVLGMFGYLTYGLVQLQLVDTEQYRGGSPHKDDHPARQARYDYGRGFCYSRKRRVYL